ncbi:molybdopterin-dependent oxidoreductase [Adlercreutzia faecimuris]|uniref:Molybdopterin-dependent oxidoreductase n=1 Tax=Adlercreutzia faecimuris TaxID=2897341 RepID=A0ABS9WHY6_9ACTN|nr:molybdopterin-dependent oxidoreductase [Adlercreutzia sp. JBNU-10]MCI2242486.1 molybdopterin-dependent oxidoreductase [Adlercreutzia sp. JBNU-10]
MEFKNDLGKPWKYEEDGLTVVRTSMWSPPGCHPVGCGLKIYVNDEGVIDHVEGDENNPITKGRLCARCLALKDYVYNPSRVIYPMKRDPEFRGQHDKWERITWDEAFAIVKEKRDYFRDTYGAESMAVFSGTGRSGGILVSDMAQAVLGTPNACYTQSGYACYQPRSMSCSHVLGAYYPEMDYAGGLEGTYDNPAFIVPGVMVMWGKMPLASNGDGFFGHAVIDLMKRGAKLISVDPRVNWLSTRAVVHLRVRPGTDTAMAMAWLSVIINEDLYDHDFVEKWTYGFDEFAARINDPELGMTPEKAAEICDVPVEDIYKAARLYATAKPASIAWGLAFDQNQNGNQAAHCVLALMAITGNIDVPGGQIVAEIDAAPGVEDAPAAGEKQEFNLDKADAGADDNAAEDAARPTRRIGWDSLPQELRDKTVGYKEYPLYVDNIRNAQADMMFDALTKGEPYRIRMGWIQSTTLLAPTCCAQPHGWYEGLKNLEFCMATDLFITPAIEAACDLFLPLASCAEKDDVVMTHYGGSPVFYGAVNKAVDVGEVKADMDLIIELGAYLEQDCLKNEDGTPMFKDLDDFLTQRRTSGPIKMDFDSLRHRVGFQRGVNYRKYESGKLRPDRHPGFLTPTGRVELWSTAYANYGEDPLPYYQEPAFSPAVDPELAEKYPYILTTGARNYASFHAEHRQIPVLRELHPDPLIEINPADAAEIGVADGQWVEIANDFGRAKFKAKVSPIVKKGTVQADHGWWFPEMPADDEARDQVIPVGEILEDGPLEFEVNGTHIQNGYVKSDHADEKGLYGLWRSNVNDLVSNHYNSKLGYGGPYKCNCCSITPLQESYDTDMGLVEEKFKVDSAKKEW